MFSFKKKVGVDDGCLGRMWTKTSPASLTPKENGILLSSQFGNNAFILIICFSFWFFSWSVRNFGNILNLPCWVAKFLTLWSVLHCWIEANYSHSPLFQKQILNWHFQICFNTTVICGMCFLHDSLKQVTQPDLTAPQDPGRSVHGVRAGREWDTSREKEGDFGQMLTHILHNLYKLFLWDAEVRV